MNKQTSSQAGFSILELVIALSLTTVVMTVAGQSLYVSLGAWSDSVQRVQMRQNSRMALSSMLNEIRYARAILSPSGQQSDADRLVFTNESGVRVSYQLGTSSGINTRTLYRSVGAVDNPLTENTISELHFSIDHAAAGQPALVSVEMNADMVSAERGLILRSAVACPNIE